MGWVWGWEGGSSACLRVGWKHSAPHSLLLLPLLHHSPPLGWRLGRRVWGDCCLWESRELAVKASTCTAKCHPSPFPFLLTHTSFPEHFKRGWDQAKEAKSERKQVSGRQLPLLRASLSFISEEELSHLQEASMTLDCIQKFEVSSFTRHHCFLHAEQCPAV